MKIPRSRLPHYIPTITLTSSMFLGCTSVEPPLSGIELARAACVESGWTDEAGMATLISAAEDSKRLGFSKDENKEAVWDVCQQGDTGCFTCGSSVIDYVYDQ